MNAVLSLSFGRRRLAEGFSLGLIPAEFPVEFYRDRPLGRLNLSLKIIAVKTWQNSRFIPLIGAQANKHHFAWQVFKTFGSMKGIPCLIYL